MSLESHIREGYPSYISDETCERIEADLEKQVYALFAVLRAEFGRGATKNMNPYEVWDVMREMAQQSAHTAAGDMSSQGVREAQQASRNLFNGVMAGIKLGQQAE